MSNKELTPDDSERARKETDGLKDELEKACGEKEVNNKNNRQDYTKELEKLRTTDSENSRKALEEEALVLEQLREIKLKKAKADLLQARKKNHTFTFKANNNVCSIGIRPVNSTASFGFIL